MADMHRLGHVRPAIVDNDSARGLVEGRTQTRISDNLCGALGQGAVAEAQIDKARPGNLDRTEQLRRLWISA